MISSLHGMIFARDFLALLMKTIISQAIYVIIIGLRKRLSKMKLMPLYKYVLLVTFSFFSCGPQLLYTCIALEKCDLHFGSFLFREIVFIVYCSYYDTFYVVVVCVVFSPQKMY
jgi:hypothetical protein